MLDHTALSYRWVSSVADLDPLQWDRCFEPGDTYNSHELFAVLEESKLPNTEFCHLIGEADGELRLALPCYFFRSPLYVLAPPPVRRIAERIRTAYAPFLVMRTLIVGTPLAISGDSFGFHQIPHFAWESAFCRIKGELVKKAREHRLHVIALKELPDDLLKRFGASLEPEFLIVPSMPASTLRLQPGQPYETRLRSHYRSLLRQKLKLSDAGGVEWAVREDVAECADSICDLYRQVLARSKTKFEELTPEFFRNVSRLKGRVKFLTATYRDRLVGFALLVFSKQSGSPIYIGLDYELRDQFAIYYNIFYRAIQEADAARCLGASLGQTAYESKAILGADFQPLSLGLCALSPGIRLILRSGRPILFPLVSPKTNRVFKTGDAEASTESRGETIG